MKKEVFALVLLLALLAGGLYNTHYLRSFTSGLADTLHVSESSCAAGEYERALELAERAHESWHSRAAYAGIFIRHTEIDAVTYGFHDLISALKSSEPEGAAMLYSGLIGHIESLYEMERLSPASIF